MELRAELEKLRTFFQNSDTRAFKTQLKLLKDNFSSESDISEMDEYIDKMIAEEMVECDRAFNELKLKAELILNKDIIPFSYIAKKYFKKSKSWIYQRINGNSINGKLVDFTSEEVNTFNFAIQDISKRLGSMSVA